MPQRFDQQIWDKAKGEARAKMIEHARKQSLIAYSDLSAQIHAISFKPNDRSFFQLLEEISKEEEAQGRGMLSAIVVHKDGDMISGDGFFDLARRLHKDVTDKLEFWVFESQKVFKIHKIS